MPADNQPRELPRMRKVGAVKAAPPAPFEVKEKPFDFVCPFSGEKLEFRECGPNRHVMVISSFGWSSKLFPSIFAAKEWASTRNGVATWHKPAVSVLGTREAPEGHPAGGLFISPDDVGDDSLPQSLQGRG